MIILPVWALVCLCLPSVGFAAVCIFAVVLALLDTRKEYIDELRGEIRAEFESGLSPMERSFRPGEEAIERKNRIYFEGEEIEQIDELLVLAMEEMMSLNSRDRFQNFLGEEERKHLHEMMDADAVFLKRVRHFSGLKEEKTDADT